MGQDHYLTDKRYSDHGVRVNVNAVEVNTWLGKICRHSKRDFLRAGYLWFKKKNYLCYAQPQLYMYLKFPMGLEIV